MNKRNTKFLRATYHTLYLKAWHGSYEDWAGFITPFEIKGVGKGWRQRGQDYAHNYRIMNRIGLPK